MVEWQLPKLYTAVRFRSPAFLKMQKSKIRNFSLFWRPAIKMGKIWFIFLIFDIWILNFIGCVTTPLVSPPMIEGIPGFYHRVEKSQTLWRISNLYDVDLDEIVRINRIADATNIEVGQLIFIPRPQKQQPVISIKSSLDDFIWPIKGKVIASFGQTFNNIINKGINIQVNNETDVVSSRSGRVVFYNPNFKGYGRTIIIDHGDGFQTVYARNSRVFIKLGDYVERGSLISQVAPGEDRITYLHFEIRKGYIPQNPYFYLPQN